MILVSIKHSGAGMRACRHNPRAPCDDLLTGRVRGAFSTYWRILAHIDSAVDRRPWLRVAAHRPGPARRELSLSCYRDVTYLEADWPSLERPRVNMSPAMSTRASPKFTLVDAMIVVAALAVWFAALRYLAELTNLTSIWHLGDYGFFRILRNQIGLLLCILSAAVLVMGLRLSCHGRRRLWLEPGLAACAAAILGVAVQTVFMALVSHAGLLTWERFAIGAFWSGWPRCGPAVAGSWLTLIVTGRWRARRGSIDRLGRVVGACWLLEYFCAEMPGTRWAVIIIGRLLEVIR